MGLATLCSKNMIRAMITPNPMKRPIMMDGFHENIFGVENSQALAEEEHMPALCHVICSTDPPQLVEAVEF